MEACTQLGLLVQALLLEACTQLGLLVQALLLEACTQLGPGVIVFLPLLVVKIMLMPVDSLLNCQTPPRCLLKRESLMGVMLCRGVPYPA